jgi:hypothetical protein
MLCLGEAPNISPQKAGAKLGPTYTGRNDGRFWNHWHGAKRERDKDVIGTCMLHIKMAPGEEEDAWVVLSLLWPLQSGKVAIQYSIPRADHLGENVQKELLLTLIQPLYRSREQRVKGANFSVLG